jgi:hypothetical protein
MDPFALYDRHTQESQRAEQISSTVTVFHQYNLESRQDYQLAKQNLLRVYILSELHEVPAREVHAH